MKYQKGTVRWFDNLSGEGIIRVGDEIDLSGAEYERMVAAADFLGE